MIRARSSTSSVRPDAAASVFLLATYCATLAHGVTYWDAGEFLAAIHSLGIPHPPGTPLFILVARVWSMIVAPLVGFTISVNAFSAVCTAIAFGLVANLFWRWTHDGVSAFCAAVTGGLMSTVWLNATETEVYAPALCLSMLILWSADRAARTGQSRWLVLTGYLCGLGWALHLTALLTVPAAIAVIMLCRTRVTPRTAAYTAVMMMIGASVVFFMLVRARHDPALNQADPVTWRALLDAIQRRQYDVAPLWPRRAPVWIQFGNVFEYADWQVALGLSPTPPPSWIRTPFTVLYAVLGVYGAIRHRVLDRMSWRTWFVFLVTASVGVVVYLNMRAGASFGYGVLPSGTVHEARDRDYFFTWAFVAWGAWAGMGTVAFVRRVVARMSSPHRVIPARRIIAAAGVLAALPLTLNWAAIRTARHDEQQRAERDGMEILANLPENAVFLAVGDNDTYLVWYLQEVQGVRRDVTVVTVPLLPPVWYRAELRRRHHLLGSTFVQQWYGTDATLNNVRAHASQQRRPVIQSSYTPWR